jgi:hypothetical protein
MKTKVLMFILLLGLGLSCSEDSEDPVLSTETDILTFTLDDETGAATINATNHTIDIEVDNGTDLSILSPTFTLSAGATSVPSSGTSGNYSSEVTINVTAEDGVTRQAWKVNVTEDSPIANTETDILTFTIPEKTGDATINDTDHTVAIEVANGTDLTMLTPAFTLSEGAASSPASGIEGNYSSEVTITITAEDGSTAQDWKVNVSEAAPVLSTETDILTFTIPEKTGDATINDTDNTIAIEVANGTDLTKLTPIFTLSEGATSSPESGSEGNYSSEVTITVTAEDGTTTQDWKVNITEASGPSSAADVLAFSLPEQTELATIDDSGNSIAIEVTNGTNLASLTPTITISPGATSNPASEATGNYSSVVTIKVTAEDGTTVEDWTVNVTEAVAGGPPSSANDILTYTVPGQEQDEYIDSENHVVIVVTASGTDLSNITPTFTLSPGATSIPVSGTPGDYNDATLIAVTAEDGSKEQLWGVKIFNGFDAAGVCDVAKCADDPTLQDQCISRFNSCIATYGEAAFVPCALVATGFCD